MNSKLISCICGVPTKAVETDAPWKLCKTQKAGFTQFPPRLENSPRKTRSEFSTVPTASATILLSFKKEPVSSCRNCCSFNRTCIAIATLRCTRIQASRSAISSGALAQGKFLLDIPFHRTRPAAAPGYPGDPQKRRLTFTSATRNRCSH